MKNKTLLIVASMCFFMLTNKQAYSIPTLEIPNDLIVTSKTQIDIPINISDIQGSGMIGFGLRLDYDTDQLSNPTVITNGTLTEGLTVESAVPIDGHGGKYSIALLNGFSPDNDGILIKVRFDVSPSFSAANILFVSEETRLNNATFDPIEPMHCLNGFLMRFETIYANETASAGKYDTFEDKSAYAGAMELSVQTFDDNGYLFSGHDNGNEIFTPGSVADYLQIVDRVWYIKTHDDVPDSTIIQFHIRPGLTELSDYGLLFSSTIPSEPADYTEVVQASVVDTVNDIIQFQLNSAQLKTGYYSLATTTPPASDDKMHVVPTLNEYGIILLFGILLFASMRTLQRVREKI